MTQTNDPPLVASVALIPDSDEKADLDAPSSQSGKLVVSQAPNITITSTTVVADEAERLALDPQEGDIAIQQDTTESFIFTGGANELANWQLVQFDAVGGIAGEDIAPRDIDGRNVVVTDIDTDTLTAANSLDTPDLTATDLTVNGLFNGADTSGAAAGEALTSDGQGGFGFAPTGSAAILRNGQEIEYVARDVNNLPSPNATQDVALITAGNDYVQDKPPSNEFDIATASFQKSINTQDSGPSGIAFDTDGTRLYEVGEDGSKIYQSSLSTPFDIASATFAKSINTQDSSPTGMAFNSDGSRLYEVGLSGTKIYQSSLSTPFDIASATFAKSINTQDGFPRGIAFNTDGTRLYEVGNSGRKIYQSSLSTPFDIASASFQKSINTRDGFPAGIAFDTDGTRLYEVGLSGQKIYQLSLSTPFDIASDSFQKSISTQDSGPTGMAFNSDGSRLYEVGEDGDKIYQFEVGLPVRWETI